MYAASNGFKQAVKGSGRRFYTKAEINGGDGNGGVTLYGDGLDGAIVDITLEATMDSGGLSIGGTPSSSCSMTIRLPSSPLALVNGTFKPYVGMMVDGDVEWIPLGVFYITDVEQQNAAVATVSGYDGMYLLAQEYVPSASVHFPTNIPTLLADIEQQTGLHIPAFQVAVVNFPYVKGTCRDWVGWIAGWLGTNAYCDRNGDLRFKWYTTEAYNITATDEYMNGVESTAMFTVQSLTSGTSDNVIVSGNGAGITFPNPFMTKTRLDALADAKIGQSYLPLTCEWRGDPCVDVGDIIGIEIGTGIYTTFVMSHTLSIAGGIKDSLRAEAPTEAEIRFDTTPTQQKINQVYTALQAALADAAALINGTKGGIYEVTDSNNDGVNDGWILKASPDPNFAGNVIVANSSGIGFSDDGGASYNVAITTDGHIDGRFITAGSISAEQIQVGGQTLGSYVYVGHRRINDSTTPIVMRVGALGEGRVTEIRGDRTSIFDAATYAQYTAEDSTKDISQLDAQALFFYTDQTLVMQKVDSIQLGTGANSLLIQPLSSGYAFTAGE